MKRGLLIPASCICAFLAIAGEGGYKQYSVHTMPFDGVVTYYRPTDDYFFMKASDGSGVWRVQVGDKRETALVKPGAMISVASGETRENSTTRRVLKATLSPWQGAEDDEMPMPDYRNTTLARLYTHPLNTPGAEDLWGELVSCEGVVRDINRRQNFTQLQVGSGDYSFQATVRIGIDTALPEDLKLGAKVRVSGIMLYSPVDDPSHRSMQDFTDVSVMPAGIEGVEVVSSAPFWTPWKIWLVTGIVSVMGLLVFLWAAFLRKKLFATMRKRIKDEVAFEATHRERLRLARDLHDDFQQLLAGAMFKIGAAQNKLEEGDVPGAGEMLVMASQALNYTQTQLRTVLWGLNEESEGPSSLVGLIKYAAERMAHWKGIVEISSSGSEAKLARSVSGTLLMILQEAVANALNHGFATHVKVDVAFSRDSLTLAIEDNGVGFDAAAATPGGHYGLRSMRERAAHVGASFALSSRPGGPTRIVVAVPLGRLERRS